MPPQVEVVQGDLSGYLGQMDSTTDSISSMFRKRNEFVAGAALGYA